MGYQVGNRTRFACTILSWDIKLAYISQLVHVCRVGVVRSHTPGVSNFMDSIHYERMSLDSTGICQVVVCAPNTRTSDFTTWTSSRIKSDE